MEGPVGHRFHFLCSSGLGVLAEGGVGDGVWLDMLMGLSAFVHSPPRPITVALAASAGLSLQLTLGAAVVRGMAGSQVRASLWPLSLQCILFCMCLIQTQGPQAHGGRGSGLPLVLAVQALEGETK